MEKESWELMRRLGAGPRDVDELRDYTRSEFDLSPLDAELCLPLADEPFLATWRLYAEEVGRRGAFACLVDRLPQLAFPIRAGMSADAEYRAAVRRGAPVALMARATGLEIENPEGVELRLHRSSAGTIPMLVVRRRSDFVALVRSLSMGNEPQPVPDALGALMVSGYNNWDRIQTLRRRWEESPPEVRERATWDDEFRHITRSPALYQDRFILVSDGPYGGVDGEELGIDAAAWRELSILMRVEHECCHYLMRRLLGSMRNNLFDELLADYAGIVAARGRFDAAWFLRFLGLDGRELRPGGRAGMYRGAPPLSDTAFAVVRELTVRAARNVEAFDLRLALPDGPRRTVFVLLALASLRLDLLAGAQAVDLLAAAVERLERRVRWRGDEVGQVAAQR